MPWSGNSGDAMSVQDLPTQMELVRAYERMRAAGASASLWLMSTRGERDSDSDRQRKLDKAYLKAAGQFHQLCRRVKPKFKGVGI